jgi:hypothetical protein
MAAGRDRYEPLREAARKVESQKQGAEPSRDQARGEKDEQRADDRGSAQHSENGTLSPTLPTTPPLQKWTHLGGREPHETSALRWHKANNERNKAAHQQAKQQQPTPQSRAASVEPAQKTKEQKTEQTKDKPAPLENNGRKLRFYEDLNPRGVTKEHERER